MRSALRLGLCLAVFVTTSVVVADPTVHARDLTRLVGAGWKGTLTYMDYTSERQVIIPVQLTVIQDASGDATFSFSYPDEPHMNGSSRIVFSQSGTMLSGAAVVELTAADTSLRIVTLADGTDNEQPARIRHTYNFGENELRIRKEVRPLDAADFFFRNEFAFKR